MLNMAERILWDEYEAAILLDALIQVRNGTISRSDAVSAVSAELRRRARRKGLKIDDVFRNENGISWQMSAMEYNLTDGESGHEKGSDLFRSVVQLYKTDPQAYQALLREARAPIPEQRSVRDAFVSWLATQVTAKRLSKLYLTYVDIEAFCIEHGILTKKLFETTDLEEIQAVVDTVRTNRIIRFQNRKNLADMESAIQFYSRYLQHHPELNASTRQPETLGEKVLPISPPAREEAQPVRADAGRVSPQVVDFSDVASLPDSEPTSFSYFGEEHAEIQQWPQLYVQVVSCLLEDYPETVEGLLGQSIAGQGGADFADAAGAAAMNAPEKVAENLYLETKRTTTEIVDNIHKLLDICYVDAENLVIRYVKVPSIQISSGQTEPPVTQEKTEPAQEERTEEAVALKPNERVKFIAWLQKSGVGVAQIGSYIASIRKCRTFAQDCEICDDNLFQITDRVRLEQIGQELFGPLGVVQCEKMQKQHLKAAFDLLLAFRAETEKNTARSAPQQPQPQQGTLQEVEVKPAGSMRAPAELTSNRYAVILEKYFGEDGYQPGRAITWRRFQRYYAAEFGCEVPSEREQTERNLRRIGTERDGRIFPKQNAQQNSLVEEMIGSINAAFQDGASGVSVEAVYDKYQQQLADGLQIYNKESLADLLLEHEKRFRLKRSYLVIGWGNADPSADILRVMKTFHQPKTYDEIHRETWYIPYDKMKQVLASKKSMVRVEQGTYFYAPNLPIGADELERIREVIRTGLEYRAHITDGELMELLEEKYPDIAGDLEGFTTYGVRNCLGYLLREQFSFRGPIISAIGSELRMSDVYAEFARDHETLRLEELQAFSSEMNTSIYWDAVMNEMVRVSEDTFVRRDLILFDVEATDGVLEELCPGSYMPLKEVALFLYFPQIGYPWNQYVLESYLYSGSRKFRLLHTSFVKNSVYGAIARVDSEIVDYRTMIVDALSRSDAVTSTTAALQYMVNCGFQQRRSYEGIEQVVQEAKREKERREREEK